MPQIRFTDTNVKALRPGEYSDPRFPNLRLRVGRSQKKEVHSATWGVRLRRQADGSRPWLKLGRWPELSCEAAAIRFKEETARIARGQPAEDLEQRIRELEQQLRAAKRAAGRWTPFEGLVERFLKDYVPKSGVPLSEGALLNYRSVLIRDAVPRFRGSDASSLDHTEMQLLIDEVTRRAPSQGIKLYKNLRTMYRWARHRNLVWANPTELLVSPGNYKTRDRVLDKDELRRVWVALDELTTPSARPILKLAVLTWQRRAEVAHLPWSEITEDRTWWYLGRTKNRKRTAVYLASTSRALLRSQEGRCALYCFPGQRPGRPISLQNVTWQCQQVSNRLLEKGEIRERFTTHDLRRTGATLARELGADRHVVGRILNHSKADVTAIYDRYGMKPEVKQVLTHYDEFIRDLVGLKPGEF